MMVLRRLLNSTAPFSHALASSAFVWIDLELTGLDVEKDEIMELACIPTTPDLELLHPGISIQLHLSPQSLAKMNDWCVEHHAKSGLTEACRTSTITLQDAEKIVVEYIGQHTAHSDKRYMAGNTIYMDRLFINKYMPLVDRLHHYRLIDVSTVKTLGEHWYPDELGNLPPKDRLHRGFDDIKESIQELKAYRQLLFK